MAALKGRETAGDGMAADEIFAVSHALRADQPVIAQALACLFQAPRAPELEWLATEAARFLERDARRRHPGVDEIFDALGLEGDLAAVAREVDEALRRRLLEARRQQTVPSAGEAQQWADETLLGEALVELRAALTDEHLRARVAPAGAARRRVAALKTDVFDLDDPVTALRGQLGG